MKGNFYDFYKQVDQIKTSLLQMTQVIKMHIFTTGEFATFYDTWRLNKTIGGGIKNFRYYCHARDNIDKNAEFKCNMHPHNYYLEILTETGILGFLVLVITFCLTLYKTFYKKYFSKSPIQNNTIIPFLFLFFVEVFPIKSTGSFFTTGNATYLFLILGILIGLSQKDISIEKKI